MLGSVRCFLIVILFIPTLQVYARTNFDLMAKKLTLLRAENEKINEEINKKRESFEKDLNVLDLQARELSVSFNQKVSEEKKLKSKKKKLEHKSNQTTFNLSDMNNFLLSLIKDLKELIKSEIPFKKVQRLMFLNNLEEGIKLNRNGIDENLSLVWNFIEDELRMTNENGIFRDSIILNNEKYLATVARIGMIMLYFKLPNDSVGVALKKDGHYIYQIIRDRDEVQAINYLFLSLKKQIRTGGFLLPNYLSRSYGLKQKGDK